MSMWVRFKVVIHRLFWLYTYECMYEGRHVWSIVECGALLVVYKGSLIEWRAKVLHIFIDFFRGPPLGKGDQFWKSFFDGFLWRLIPWSLSRNCRQFQWTVFYRKGPRSFTQNRIHCMELPVSACNFLSKLISVTKEAPGIISSSAIHDW